MTDYQTQLDTIARRVAADFARRPDVTAILLTGSVSRGDGDAASDVDMSIYYDPLPDAAELEAIRDAAVNSGGGVYGFNPEEGLACYSFVDGVKVDTAHAPAAGIDEAVAAFVAEPELENSNLHVMFSGILRGVPLYGDARIRAWQDRLAPAGATLAEPLIRHHLRFPPRAVLGAMGVDRGDYPFVYELLTQTVDHLLNIWCGLNQRIPPGKIKGYAAPLRGQTLLPADAAERVAALYTAPPHDAVADLYRLVEETLILIETHRPEIDTGTARHRLDLPLHKRPPTANR